MTTTSAAQYYDWYFVGAQSPELLADAEVVIGRLSAETQQAGMLQALPCRWYWIVRLTLPNGEQYLLGDNHSFIKHVIPGRKAR